MSDQPSIWAIVEALATVGAATAAAIAAGFAGYQTLISRRDANARAVLDHLRTIDEKLQPVWRLDVPAVQRQLLAYYRGELHALPPEAKDYLAFLNSLDLLAFAIDKKLVDGKTVDEHIVTLVHPTVLSLTFLTDLQRCCGDSSVYEHLSRHFTRLQREGKTRLPSEGA